MTPLTITVVGEGRDERGAPRRRAPFEVVPRGEHGAMEILMRRALYALCRGDGDPAWHAGLEDQITVRHPPAVRDVGMVEALEQPHHLSALVVAALRPPRQPPRVDLFIATHDGDTVAAFELSVRGVQSGLGLTFPVAVPKPHIQAWLTTKRAVERVYQPATPVPEVDEAALQQSAKDELDRLLHSFGERRSATKQAELAAVIADEDLERREGWSVWREAKASLKPAAEAAVLALPSS